MSLLESAARSLGVELIFGPPGGFEVAFDDALDRRAEAILVLQGQASLANADLIVGLAERHRLPAMYWDGAFVGRGGLMAYQVRASEINRRAADYVDRILRGTRPADLPVELPTRYDLILNLRTARALGLRFGRDFMAQVDEVIE